MLTIGLYRYSLKRSPVSIHEGDTCMSLCMFPKERKEFFKEFQIFISRKHGDALFRIVGFLFFEIRGSKKIKSGFSFPVTGHTRVSGFH